MISDELTNVIREGLDRDRERHGIELVLHDREDHLELKDLILAHVP